MNRALQGHIEKYIHIFNRYTQIFYYLYRNHQARMSVIDKYIRRYIDMSTFGINKVKYIYNVSIYGRINVSIYETKGVINAIS